MSEYKYLLCGYDITKHYEDFVDVKLIGIYKSYDEAYNIQKKFGVIESIGKCLKGPKFCTWIHLVKLIDGTFEKSLSLRNTHLAMTPII